MNNGFIVRVLKLVGLTAMGALIAGCSSNSYEVTQYRLPHLSQSADALCLANKRPVFVGDSAAKPGLQLQQDETRWHSARQHRWSTPLAHQLQRSAQRLLLADNCDGKLTVWVDDFYGSNDSKAVVAGHWQYQSADAQIVLEGAFTEKVPLKSDGYPALVNALDTAWLNVMDTISLGVGDKVAR
ncbi:MAG: PqiC family protein [Pseudomonadota bacterium]